MINKHSRVIVSYVPIDSCRFCFDLFSRIFFVTQDVLICNYDKQINMLLDWYLMGGDLVLRINKYHTQMQRLHEKKLQTDNHRLIKFQSEIKIIPSFSCFFLVFIAMLIKTFLRLKKIIPRDHALKIPLPLKVIEKFIVM